MRVTDNGARRPAGKVSGWRNPNQISATIPNSNRTIKIARHAATSKIACPSAGATIGTMMNTAMINDITRAIALPANRSRINAIDTPRGPATPNPCSNRPASIIGKLTAAIASSDPAKKRAKPR